METKAMIHIHEIHRAPEGVTVHYFSYAHSHASFRHVIFCGTPGFDLVLSAQPSQVTCRRCLSKLRTCSDQRFASDPNVTMTEATGAST
jgi:hypothetical protein